MTAHQRRKLRRLRKQLKATAARQRPELVLSGAVIVQQDGPDLIEAADRSKPAGEDGAASPAVLIEAYTGGKMRPANYPSEVVVDVARSSAASQKIPILWNHDHDQIVGHTIRVTGQHKFRMRGVLSGVGSRAVEVRDLAAAGFPIKASIGGSILTEEPVAAGQRVYINGRWHLGPFTRITSDIREVSLVAIAADDNTSVKINGCLEIKANRGKGVEKMNIALEKWIQSQGIDIDDLTPEEVKKYSETFVDMTASADCEPAALEGAEMASMKASGAEQVAQADDAPAELADGVKELRASTASELMRLSKIRDIAARYDNPTVKTADGESFIQVVAAAEGWTAEKAELESLRASRAPYGFSVGKTEGAPDINATLAASMAASVRVPETQLAKQLGAEAVDRATSREYRGAGFFDIFDRVIAAAGGNYRGARGGADYIREVNAAENRLNGAPNYNSLAAASGASTVSVTNIIGDSANAIMLQSYNYAPRVSAKIAAVRNARNFNTHSKYRIEHGGRFQNIGSDGELQSSTLSEQVFTTKLTTFGARINLDRQHVINDDLEAFSEIPRAFGASAASAVESELFKLILSNPSSFFSTANANLMTGGSSVLSIDSLGTAVAKFLDFVDTAGMPVASAPKWLLCGSELAKLADDLHKSELIVTGNTTAAPNRNSFRGLYDVAATPWLSNAAAKDSGGASLSGQSATQWYLVSDPLVNAFASVSYLNGNEFPVIESQSANFEVLGISYRGYIDFGVGMEDTAAAVKSAGA